MRILVVDDHPIVLGGLERLFASAPDFSVVGRCQTGAQAIAAAGELAPDLVLLDFKLPDMTGLDVLRAIKTARPGTVVVLLSAVILPAEALAARELGADGLLYKDLVPGDLLNELRRAAAGLRPFPDDIAVDPMIRRFAQLTPRERDVALAAARGLRNRAIADELGIAAATVKLHLHNIYEKLGVQSRVELAIAAGRMPAP